MYTTYFAIALNQFRYTKPYCDRSDGTIRFGCGRLYVRIGAWRIGGQ